MTGWQGAGSHLGPSGAVWGCMNNLVTLPLAESPEPLSQADSSPQPKPSDEMLCLFGGVGVRLGFVWLGFVFWGFCCFQCRGFNIVL